MARKLELHFKHGKKFTDAFEIPISNFLRLQTAKKSVLNPSLKAFSFPHVLEAKTARNGQEWNKSWKDLDRSWQLSLKFQFRILWAFRLQKKSVPHPLSISFSLPPCSWPRNWGMANKTGIFFPGILTFLRRIHFWILRSFKTFSTPSFFCSCCSSLASNLQRNFTERHSFQKTEHGDACTTHTCIQIMATHAHPIPWSMATHAQPIHTHAHLGSRWTDLSPSHSVTITDKRTDNLDLLMWD